MVELTNKKKICIAIHGLAHAGAERVAATWANYLSQQGHRVFFLVYAHTQDSYALSSGVEVFSVADAKNEYFKMPMAKRLWRIRNIVRTEQPEIIINFLPKMQITMMLATIGMNIRRIETVRNNPWIDKDVEGKRVLWNLCFYRSDTIIVQTQEQAHYFSEKLKKKCVVISNPISGEFTDRHKVYGNGKIRRFVAVARINTQKNYSMMIQAFAKSAQADCTLDIYGAGSQNAMQELQALIDRMGVTENITLCGWNKDISRRLTEYDAFLMSSDYEGMPNALAEAMATGLVCLSTDCKTGPKDMIEHGVSGFLAKTGDIDSFAAGICKILQMDRKQCSDMGIAARKKILDMCSEANTLERLKYLIEAGK